jgi:hypothetical protein
MTNIIEGLIDEKSMKKQIEERVRCISDALSKITEGWNKMKEGALELSKALEKDDLSFVPLVLGCSNPESEIFKAFQERGLLETEGVGAVEASCEATPAITAPLPTAEEQRPKQRGKRMKELFLDAVMSVKWVRLCKQFFAPYMNDEIDASLSNRVLQRFAWFLSTWQEWGLLVAQLFSPAVRFLQALGFRLVISFQTCTNVLREIFARREEFQDAKSEVLAFCMAHA